LLVTGSSGAQGLHLVGISSIPETRLPLSTKSDSFMRYLDRLARSPAGENV